MTTQDARLTEQVAARVEALLSRYKDPVVAAMRAALDRPGEHLRLMRYHLGWEDAAGNQTPVDSGKMLRPALCLLCCEAVGGGAARAMPAAAALELLHNFTLIHDDIEDASDTRHRRATLWRVAGVPRAINAGDGMFVLAQRTLLGLADTGLAPPRVLEAARVLDEACVVLCEGQHADISFETRTRVTLGEYEAMIGGKTAALLGAAAAIGAIAGGADDATAVALGECGRRLGMAFQIQDDVLGIWGESDVTGKPVADDIRSRKKSFPVVYAFDHLSADRLAQLERIYAHDRTLEQGAKTGVVSVDDVDAVLSLLESIGARAAATAEAERWSRSALAVLAPLKLEPERRSELEALASFFVHREK
ncbi:MAG: polyprenyl synthetase family protein [Chloroflexota bacterium]|nr:polyprenyl synthetase family protein [Chloroflexota bacterium]